MEYEQTSRQAGMGGGQPEPAAPAPQDAAPCQAPDAASAGDAGGENGALWLELGAPDAAQNGGPLAADAATAAAPAAASGSAGAHGPEAQLPLSVPAEPAEAAARRWDRLRYLLPALLLALLVGVAAALGLRYLGCRRAVAGVQALYDAQDHAGCAAAATAALEQYPDEPALVQLYGRACYALEDYAAACDAFARLPAAGLSDEARAEYAAALLATGQLQAAYDTYLGLPQPASLALLAQLAQQAAAARQPALAQQCIGLLAQRVPAAPTEANAEDIALLRTAAAQLAATLSRTAAGDRTLLFAAAGLYLDVLRCAGLEDTAGAASVIDALYTGYCQPAPTSAARFCAVWQLLRTAQGLEADPTWAQLCLEGCARYTAALPAATLQALYTGLSVTEDVDTTLFVLVQNVWAGSTGLLDQLASLQAHMELGNYRSALELWQSLPQAAFWYQNGQIVLAPADGEALQVLPAGGVYWGMVQNGLPNGSGRHIRLDESGTLLYYDGQWAAGAPQGSYAAPAAGPSEQQPGGQEGGRGFWGSLFGWLLEQMLG